MLHLLLSNGLAVFCCVDFVGAGEGLGVSRLRACWQADVYWNGTSSVLLLPISTERRQSYYQLSTEFVECFGGVDS
jgi:hypothetical protein